jgi:hypothetical protein
MASMNSIQSTLGFISPFDRHNLRLHQRAFFAGRTSTMVMKEKEHEIK